MTADLNITIAGLLDDMASLQTSVYPRRAYERAARSVALADRPLTELTRQELDQVPHLGRSARKVVDEVLARGHSTTVDAAIHVNSRTSDIDRRRSQREGFLSLAAARQVLAHAAGKAVGLKDYRGDFQMHSEWSDGARTIAEMALACVERGYQHMAITDHSRGLSIARGLSADAMVAQHREIDALNATLGDRFRVLKGIEANILADGTVDVTDAERATCDLVLAAPHSALDSTADQTTRLLRAVNTPGVHVLAHPSGRKFGRRPGLRVDWPRVFDAAVRANVAIEIDADPSRQDLPYALVVRALDAGVTFAIDSDAHDTDQLVYAEIGIAHARLAGVPPARIINCWPTRKLMTWLASRP
jgi:histidinol phosphatase-like PHP family hydrolase